MIFVFNELVNKMPQKEFVNLIEQNMIVLAWLTDRLKISNSVFFRHPRQQLELLVRLYLGGRARLKDISERECTPTSNLCATFRILESQGLVRREIDESDRRNTWYSMTSKGEKLAIQTIELFRARIMEIFAGLNKADEARLTSALRTINELVTKIKEENLNPNVKEKRK